MACLILGLKRASQSPPGTAENIHLRALKKASPSWYRSKSCLLCALWPPDAERASTVNSSAASSMTAFAAGGYHEPPRPHVHLPQRPNIGFLQARILHAEIRPWLQPDFLECQAARGATSLSMLSMRAKHFVAGDLERKWNFSGALTAPAGP
jgi:hypothetical protein